jgi:hypothetical protein
MPQFIESVNKRAPRVTPSHVRTGITHHLTNAFALLFFVAMDGAFGAGRFGFTVGTLGQAPFCIAHQLSAGIAQAVNMPSVVVVTIDSGHAH